MIRKDRPRAKRRMCHSEDKPIPIAEFVRIPMFPIGILANSATAYVLRAPTSFALPVQVVASHRDVGAALVRFAEETLVQPGGSVAEAVGDRDQVDSVDSVTHLVGCGNRFGL